MRSVGRAQSHRRALGGGCAVVRVALLAWATPPRTMLDGRSSEGEGVRIVCIGWGSLVWDPGVLRRVGDWQTDGPTLPLEFARISRDGRLTLVLTPGAAPVPTSWCELNYQTGEAARAALAGREGPAIHAIGLWPAQAPNHTTGHAEICQWGEDRGVDAVIWTALRPRFDGVDGAGPKDAVTAASYLSSLTGDALVRASEYVRRAPEQVRTGFRAALEATFAATQGQEPEIPSH